MVSYSQLHKQEEQTVAETKFFDGFWVSFRCFRIEANVRGVVVVDSLLLLKLQDRSTPSERLGHSYRREMFDLADASYALLLFLPCL